jgi:hypothetical protein
MHYGMTNSLFELDKRLLESYNPEVSPFHLGKVDIMLHFDLLAIRQSEARLYLRQWFDIQSVVANHYAAELHRRLPKAVRTYLGNHGSLNPEKVPTVLNPYSMALAELMASRLANDEPQLITSEDGSQVLPQIMGYEDLRPHFSGFLCTAARRLRSRLDAADLVRKSTGYAGWPSGMRFIMDQMDAVGAEYGQRPTALGAHPQFPATTWAVIARTNRPETYRQRFRFESGWNHQEIVTRAICDEAAKPDFEGAETMGLFLPADPRLKNAARMAHRTTMEIVDEDIARLWPQSARDEPPG